MALAGEVSSEVGILAPAAKWYNLFAKELHNVQNTSDRVHQTKLLKGDWHSIGSIKEWTDIIDGKVSSYKEKIEAIDERNKTITYELFDGDFSQHYKVFKLIFQVIEKDDGSAFVKWTIEYEKVNDNVEPPYGFMDHLTKSTKDIDAYLLKA